MVSLGRTVLYIVFDYYRQFATYFVLCPVIDIVVLNNNTYGGFADSKTAVYNMNFLEPYRKNWAKNNGPEIWSISVGHFFKPNSFSGVLKKTCDSTVFP